MDRTKQRDNDLLRPRRFSLGGGGMTFDLYGHETAGFVGSFYTEYNHFDMLKST
jgi:hypothetical protein